MKKNVILSISILFLYNFQSMLTKETKNSNEYHLLTTNRTTNLIIINDVMEINDKADPFGIPSLIEALKTQQCILCTKSCWFAITIKKMLYNRDYYNVVSQNKKYDISILFGDNNWFEKLENYMKSLIYSNQPNEFQKKFINNFVNNLDQDMQDIILSFLDLIHKNLALSSQNHNKFIEELETAYICKSLSDNFLLFIPKKNLLAQKNTALQDAWMGLSYTKYPNYDFSKQITQTESSKIAAQSNFLSEDISKLNQEFIKVLQSLKINDKNITKDMLPFFNIFLIGHGSSEFIAEINISPTANNIHNESYFLKILNFFNRSIRTRSVALMSCYPGGQKLVDAYQIDNKYNNKFLDNIAYTIINIGTLYKPIRVELNTNFFLDYFSFLQETPPNYNAICSMLSKELTERHISLKFPHTSWFSPVQLKNDTMMLSQIDMSTKKTPLLIHNKKIIFLGANYIPQTLRFNDDSLDALPILLPENYHNQSYYFNNLEFTNISEDIELYRLIRHVILNNIFYEFTVLEPIKFAFKQIQIGSKIYKNVYLSYFLKDQDTFNSKLFYTDQTNQTFQYSWPFGQLPSQLSDTQVKKHLMSSLEAENVLLNFKNEILQTLSPGLQTEFIEKLEKIIEQKI